MLGLQFRSVRWPSVLTRGASDTYKLLLHVLHVHLVALVLATRGGVLREDPLLLEAVASVWR